MDLIDKIKLEKSFKITIDNETYKCIIKTGTIYYFVDISIIKQCNLFGFKFTYSKFMGYVCSDMEFPIPLTNTDQDWININKAIEIVKKGLSKFVSKKYKHLEHIVVKDSL
jgi:hypothetical protein